MSENLAPKTFRAQETSSPKLQIVIALQSIVIVGLLAYILFKQNTEVVAARSQERVTEPRREQDDTPPPPAQLQTPPPLPAPTTPPPAAVELVKRGEPEHRDARLSFRFNYLDKTETWREWRRVTPTQWEEVEPNGNITRFVVVGRMKEPTMTGTVVRRVSDLKMDVFIPDKTSTRRMHWRHAPEGQWVYMGQVSAEQVLPATNEEF